MKSPVLCGCSFDGPKLQYREEDQEGLQLSCTQTIILNTTNQIVKDYKYIKQ